MKTLEMTTSEDYRRRVNLVTDYVRTHLQENISIDVLSEISSFSPYHFQRVMSAFLGQTIGSFVQRTRLEKAADLLYHTDMSISDIAY